jgi:hypothetical protein
MARVHVCRINYDNRQLTHGACEDAFTTPNFYLFYTYVCGPAAVGEH